MERKDDDGLKEDLDQDANAGIAFKKCVLGIATLMDNAVKCNRFEKDDFKDLMWRKRKLMNINDYEEAATDVFVAGRACETHNMLSDVLSFESMWKKIASCVDANENEAKKMKECHERSIQKVKWHREKLRKMLKLR